MTNALMAEVLQLAYGNNKFSTTVEDHNGINSTTIKYGDKELLDLIDVKFNTYLHSQEYLFNAGTFQLPISYAMSLR